mgnify:CR=1 FL=1
MIDKILGWLFALAHPTYWLQLYEYSDAWDKMLSRYLKTETFSQFGSHTVRLGPFVIWIANHPYASMRCYNCGKDGPRPRRITIYRAWRKYQQDWLTAAASAKGSVP